jgi:transposase InsO family protein
MGKNLTSELREKIASARYQIILPLIKSDRDEKTELIKEISTKEHCLYDGKKKRISIRTLWRWIKGFTKEGLKGLMPKERSDKGKIRVIEDTKLNRAFELKKELPGRSTRKIIRLMELNKEIMEDEIKVSNLNRIFKEKGYTKEELAGMQSKIRRRFQRDEVNSLWQGDITDGIWLPDQETPSKMKKTFLTAFVDDCSRRLPWGEFFRDEKLPCLEITFKKGIQRCGIPNEVYVDGGKIFSSDQFKQICAELAIEIHTAPDASSKGKIEKFFQTVQQDFFPEVIHTGITTIEQLNHCFWLWLEQEYHQKIHSETGKRPIDAWNEIKNIRKVSAEKLEQIFLWRDERTVNKKTCLIDYENNCYEVIPKLKGKRVQIRFNPFDLSKIYVYYGGEFQCIATPYHMIQHQHKKVKAHEETRSGKKQVLKSSISYFNVLEEKAKENKSPELVIPRTESEPASVISQETTETEHPLKFREVDFYSLMHEKFGQFTSNERKRIKLYWKENGPFDEKLTKESITRAINTKGTSQNINYYLEAIRREHLRRAGEMELYHPNKENIVKFMNLVKDLAKAKKFPQ